MDGLIATAAPTFFLGGEQQVDVSMRSLITDPRDSSKAGGSGTLGSRPALLGGPDKALLVTDG